MKKDKYLALERISGEAVCSRKHQVLVKMVVKKVRNEWSGDSFVTAPPSVALLLVSPHFQSGLYS